MENKANILKVQLLFLFLFIHNILYNYLPFFYFKKKYLKFLGNKIGNESYVHTKVKFLYYKNLVIGDNCHIGYGAHIDNRIKITLRNNIMIAPEVKLITLGHDIDDKNFGPKGAEIIIEEDCVIFHGAMIMPGVTLGKGTVVMAGSVVTKTTEPYDVVGGNPAKFIRKRSEELDYQISQGYWFSC